MKKSGIYILLICLGILVIFYLFRNRNPFGKNNTSFAVEGDRDITRVEMISGDSRLNLEKKGEKWFVNRGGEVRKSAVLFMLKTLKEMKIKSPVSAEKFTEDIISAKVEPVRVNVFEKRKLLRSFYVYRTATNVYGNIMKLKATSKPFIVYIPGYEGDIGSHFIADELFWKPYIIFNLLPSEIKSVKFVNNSDTLSSFTITREGRSFRLGGADRVKADSTKLGRYISYFISVPFESWAYDLPETSRDSLAATVPDYTITVTQSDGTARKLVLWKRQVMENGVMKTDTDRLWGMSDEKKGFYILRYFDIDPLLKKRSWFING